MASRYSSATRPFFRPVSAKAAELSVISGIYHWRVYCQRLWNHPGYKIDSVDVNRHRENDRS